MDAEDAAGGGGGGAKSRKRRLATLSNSPSNVLDPSEKKRGGEAQKPIPQAGRPNVAETFEQNPPTFSYFQRIIAVSDSIHDSIIDNGGVHLVQEGLPGQTAPAPPDIISNEDTLLNRISIVPEGGGAGGGAAAGGGGGGIFLKNFISDNLPPLPANPAEVSYGVVDDRTFTLRYPSVGLAEGTPGTERRYMMRRIRMSAPGDGGSHDSITLDGLFDSISPLLNGRNFAFVYDATAIPIDSIFTNTKLAAGAGGAAGAAGGQSKTIYFAKPREEVYDPASKFNINDKNRFGRFGEHFCKLIVEDPDNPPITYSHYNGSPVDPAEHFFSSFDIQMNPVVINTTSGSCSVESIFTDPQQKNKEVYRANEYLAEKSWAQKMLLHHQRARNFIATAAAAQSKRLGDEGQGLSCFTFPARKWRIYNRESKNYEEEEFPAPSFFIPWSQDRPFLTYSLLLGNAFFYVFNANKYGYAALFIPQQVLGRLDPYLPLLQYIDYFTKVPQNPGRIQGDAAEVYRNINILRGKYENLEIRLNAELIAAGTEGDFITRIRSILTAVLVCFNEQTKKPNIPNLDMKRLEHLFGIQEEFYEGVKDDRKEPLLENLPELRKDFFELEQFQKLPEGLFQQPPVAAAAGGGGAAMAAAPFNFDEYAKEETAVRTKVDRYIAGIRTALELPVRVGRAAAGAGGRGAAAAGGGGEDEDAAQQIRNPFEESAAAELFVELRTIRRSLYWDSFKSILDRLRGLAGPAAPMDIRWEQFIKTLDAVYADSYLSRQEQAVQRQRVAEGQAILSEAAVVFSPTRARTKAEATARARAASAELAPKNGMKLAQKGRARGRAASAPEGAAAARAQSRGRGAGRGGRRTRRANRQRGGGSATFSSSDPQIDTFISELYGRFILQDIIAGNIPDPTEIKSNRRILAIPNHALLYFYLCINALYKKWEDIGSPTDFTGGTEEDEMNILITRSLNLYLRIFAYLKKKWATFKTRNYPSFKFHIFVYKCFQSLLYLYNTEHRGAFIFFFELFTPLSLVEEYYGISFISQENIDVNTFDRGIMRTFGKFLQTCIPKRNRIIANIPAKIEQIDRFADTIQSRLIEEWFARFFLNLPRAAAGGGAAAAAVPIPHIRYISPFSAARVVDYVHPFFSTTYSEIPDEFLHDYFKTIFLYMNRSVEGQPTDDELSELVEFYKQKVAEVRPPKSSSPRVPPAAVGPSLASTALGNSYVESGNNFSESGYTSDTSELSVARGKGSKKPGSTSGSSVAGTISPRKEAGGQFIEILGEKLTNFSLSPTIKAIANIVFEKNEGGNENAPSMNTVEDRFIILQDYWKRIDSGPINILIDILFHLTQIPPITRIFLAEHFGTLHVNLQNYILLEAYSPYMSKKSKLGNGFITLSTELTDALNTELQRIQGEGGGAAAAAEVHRFFTSSPVSKLLEEDEEAIHETPPTPPPAVAAGAAGSDAGSFPPSPFGSPLPSARAQAAPGSPLPTPRGQAALLSPGGGGGGAAAGGMSARYLAQLAATAEKSGAKAASSRAAVGAPYSGGIVSLAAGNNADV
jgi:hypothetical protein